MTKEDKNLPKDMLLLKKNLEKLRDEWIRQKKGDMETEDILKERLSRLYEHYDKLYLESQSVMEYIQDLEDELDNSRGED